MEQHKIIQFPKSPQVPPRIVSADAMECCALCGCSATIKVKVRAGYIPVCLPCGGEEGTC